MIEWAIEKTKNVRVGQKVKACIVISACLALASCSDTEVSDSGRAGEPFTYALRFELPPADRELDLPEIYGPQDSSRPLVVIDAGHGGHDPGATREGLVEKDVTLNMALALRDELIRQGGVRVALTRTDDRYLLLEERSAIAQKMDADAFVSIHADSAENETATGASVYILSEKGSSVMAEKMAERENQADRIGGVDIERNSDLVASILADLSLREMSTHSDALARMMLREVRKTMRVRDQGVQSAAFVVLKSPDIPSILFETGYISNERDAAVLGSKAGQRAFAQAGASAIRAYFARQALQ